MGVDLEASHARGTRASGGPRGVAWGPLLISLRQDRLGAPLRRRRYGWTVWLARLVPAIGVEEPATEGFRSSHCEVCHAEDHHLGVRRIGQRSACAAPCDGSAGWRGIDADRRARRAGALDGEL